MSTADTLAIPSAAADRTRPRGARAAWDAISGRLRWRAWAGAALFAAFAAAGAWLNLVLAFSALRPFVALACGALASTAVLVAQWKAQPDALGKGAAVAAAAGALCALATLA